jgi:outer membrane protein
MPLPNIFPAGYPCQQPGSARHADQVRRLLSSVRPRFAPAAAIVYLILAPGLQAQVGQVVPLTFEDAVAMAMDDSYQVRRLRMGIEQTRYNLEAERAGLKSRVFLDFSTPELERISERRWNSSLQRNEIVRENSRLWQMDFTIEQPLIVGGYTTNGYISANNRVYRYTEIDEGEEEVSYYNRYFLRYRQPFFQPNELRNDLERAELDLEEAELDFQDDAIQIIGNIAEDYYELVELAYEEVIYGKLVGNLERALVAANSRAASEPARAIDVSQAQVVLSNAQSELQQARSDLRLRIARTKPELGMDARDSIVINPELRVVPIVVDPERAVELGLTLQPRLRNLGIQRRTNEIQISNERGRNSFRVDLELTYGRETETGAFNDLLSEPSSSYTVGLTGRLPIWDWGQRKARVEAQRLVLQRTDLTIEETQAEINIDIRNVVQNVAEYLQRAQNMQQNLALATEISETSLESYRQGTISMQDLLQSFERQEATDENFLTAYMGYRDAILDLQRMTYFDFENDVPVLERFGIGTSASAVR